MLKKLILLFTLLFIASICILVHAQSVPLCGTSAGDLDKIQKRLIANKKSLLRKQSTNATSRSRETVYIPLKFHLVGRDNGSSRIESSRVFDQMCTLNEIFQDLGLQFYIKDGFNMVNSDRINNNSGTLSIRQGDMVAIRANDAVNIYVVDKVQQPQFANPVEEIPNSELLGYYLPEVIRDTLRESIVIQRRVVREGGNSLIHELGHFFSLPHPFRGWDKEPYNPEVHGSPATLLAPDGTNNELADGSNCEVAGDMICDTPADYLYFSELDGFNCTYKKPIIDANGDTLRPDSSLIMSYFPDRCSNRFTPMQTALMLEDLNRLERNNLRNEDVIVSNSINSTPVNLTLPTDASTVESTGEVELSWSNVDGASSYYVEIYPDNSTYYSIFVQENKISIGVEFGERYRWRVKPVNDTYYCAPYSEIRSFSVDMASAVLDVASVNSWSVQPNPLQDQQLSIIVNANENFNASLKITNLEGQIIYEDFGNTFVSGINKKIINTQIVSKGIYFISIETATGVSHRKLVKQ